MTTTVFLKEGENYGTTLEVYTSEDRIVLFTRPTESEEGIKFQPSLDQLDELITVLTMLRDERSGAVD